MRKYFSYLSIFFAIVLACTVMVAPTASEAKTVKKVTSKSTKGKRPKNYAYNLYNPHTHYGDEHVTIADPSSRCNTPAMHALEVQNLERAKEDGKPYGLTPESVSGTQALSPTGEAYKKYIEGLGMAWEAMEEPYCGFGAFGTAAAKKSYNKSVDHVRGRFLEAVKAAKTVALKTN